VNLALRSAMEETGRTVESLAQEVGVDPKTVSRWLTEGRVPHPRHRARTAKILSKDIEDIFPDTPRRRELAWLRPWVEIEREAESLRWYESAVLPGLLQTEAYARAVLGCGPLGGDEVESHVAVRLRRQAAVFGRTRPPLFVAIIDEFALRRGSPDLMHPQLDHLIAMAMRPNVLLRILPLSAGLHPGQAGPFVIATLRDAADVGYLDDQAAGRLTKDVTTLWSVWDTVGSVALPRDQTIDFLKARSWLT
jgi:transcriptional regulator with XRE-family HTH domain